MHQKNHEWKMLERPRKFLNHGWTVLCTKTRPTESKVHQWINMK